MKFDEPELQIAAEWLAKDRMFEFMLLALKGALRVEADLRALAAEETHPQAPAMRRLLQTFRGRFLTVGVPELNGKRLSAYEEKAANAHYRACMNTMTERVSALLDEYDG